LRVESKSETSEATELGVSFAGRKNRTLEKRKGAAPNCRLESEMLLVVMEGQRQIGAEDDCQGCLSAGSRI
jgi:hypothetical protein